MPIVKITYVADDSQLIKADRSVKTLDKDTDKLRKETTKYKKELDETGKKGEKSFNGIGAAVKGIAIGGAVIALSKLTFEALKASERAQGIKRAFDALNRPGLLSELIEATGRTVDNLTLMQAAVRAEKFQIPLKNLAGFFKFASIRAQETGQSVQYLVDSIIDGIGRKSSLILDNLGISATELQEEIKKTGDFAQAAGNIIERSMSGGKNEIDKSITSTARFAAAWENVKIAFSNFLNSDSARGVIDFLTKVIDKTSQFFDEFGGKNFTGTPEEQLFKYNEKLADQYKILRALSPESKTYLSDLDQIQRQIKDTTKTIEVLLDQLYGSGSKGDDESIIKVSDKSLQKLDKVPDKIKNIQTQTKELRKIFDGLFGKDFDTKQAEKALEKMQEGIKKVGEEAKETGKGITGMNEEILFGSIDVINSVLQSQLEAREIDWEDFRTRREDELSLAGDNEEAKMQIEKRFAAEEKRLRKIEEEEKKKAAVKSIWIDAAMGILKNIAQLGFIPAIPINLLTVAAAGVQAANVRGFEKGGYTGDIGRKEVAGVVHGQEWVSRADVTSKSRGVLEALDSGRLDDKTYKMMMSGNIMNPSYNQFDDSGIKKAIYDTAPPDYYRVGSDLYEVKRRGENHRQRARKKMLN